MKQQYNLVALHKDAINIIHNNHRMHDSPEGPCLKTDVKLGSSSCPHLHSLGKKSKYYFELIKLIIKVHVIVSIEETVLSIL